ncbi:MAG: aldo/keto reductase [Parcubacteria group bacterium Gr01-1014_33]|nr:MAG: aldo/keto reductase [Parcubacteria group bacterium Gr01-1014_33]
MPQKKLGRTNFLVSRIGLGTVELGYTYGIGPRTMPDETDAIKLLREAVEMGVTFFDTAHFYGSAEERIGKSGIAKMEGVIVATKCGHVLDKALAITKEELEKEVRKEVDESRKKLDMDTLPLVMFHGGSKKQIEEGGLIEIMQQLKDEKKVAYSGITTRGEEAPMAAIQSNFFDALQVPYSILDQRMSKAVLAEAEKKNIGIVARSVLLKGALTPAVV